MSERGGLFRMRKFWIILAIVVIIASVLTVAFGAYAHGRFVAESRARAIASARVTCEKSVSRVRQTQTAFTKTVNGKRLSSLVKLRDSQVSDTQTLRTLKQSVKNSATVASCKANEVASLNAVRIKNEKTAESITVQIARVKTVAQSVEESYKAKDVADKKKAEEERKVTEARRKAEQERQTAVQQAQRAIKAPRSTYTPQRSYNTYRAPQRSYSAPRNTYRPAPQVRHSNLAPKKSTGDNMGWENLGCFSANVGDPNDHVHEGC